MKAAWTALTGIAAALFVFHVLDGNLIGAAFALLAGLAFSNLGSRA